MGELFGREHNIKCNTIQEAMHAIDCMKGGLRAYILECTDLGINFTVQRGGEIHESIEEIEANQDDFIEMGEQDLLLGNDDLVISPIPQGSGKFSDWIKVIIGVALIVIGIMNPGGWSMMWQAFAMSVGSQIALMGIIGLLTPDSPDSKETENSLFNGPVNNAKVGIPIPLAYGRTEIGGAVINFGFTKTRMKSAPGYEWISTGAYNSNITHSGSTGGGGAVGEAETFDVHWVLDHPNKMGASE